MTTRLDTSAAHRTPGARRPQGRGDSALLLVGGVLVALLGLVLVLNPVVSALATSVLLGLTLASAGLVGTIGAWAGGREAGSLRWAGVGVGLLTLAAGLVLVFRPEVGALAVAVAVAVALLADGLSGVALSVQRRFLGWGVTLVASLASLALGVLLLAGWPSRSLELVGLYAGVVVLLRGLSVTAVGAMLWRVEHR